MNINHALNNKMGTFNFDDVLEDFLMQMLEILRDYNKNLKSSSIKGEIA